MLAVMAEPPLLLALDLSGTFAFALNGAITGLNAARLDIVGMLTLGLVTALGGGTLRDIAVTPVRAGVYGVPAAPGAAAACFLIRLEDAVL